MLDDFMTRATLAAIQLLSAAITGSSVAPQHFGRDSPCAILGVALSLALDMSIFAGAIAVAPIMALTVSALSGRGYAVDTLLGVLAHSALAFGLVAVSFLSGFG